MIHTTPLPLTHPGLDGLLARALAAGEGIEVTIASSGIWAALPVTLAAACAAHDWYLVRVDSGEARDERYTCASVDATGAVQSMTVHARFEGAPRPRRRGAGAPCGLVVAILGLDGVGKSTVIDALARELAPLFTSTARFHFRPNFGRPSTRPPETDPHGRAPRGALGGAAKLALWLVDWTVGYALVVRPLRGRGALVLFDRHLHDASVDPMRYRYSGPAWATRLLAAAAPAPDLILVLDAPVEVVEQRKLELDRAELVRQRRAYLELAAELPVARSVDASQEPASVARDAARHVVVELARRTARELGLPEPPARRVAAPG